MELNPRTSRSNYYLTASGLNPAAYWTADHLAGHWPHATEPREVLYRIVPGFLLDRYVHDESVRAAVRLQEPGGVPGRSRAGEPIPSTERDVA